MAVEPNMSGKAVVPSYKDLLWPTLRAVGEIGDSSARPSWCS